MDESRADEREAMATNGSPASQSLEPAEALAHQLWEQVRSEDPPQRPRVTYRLQVHEGFPFTRVVEILDYLEVLGISDTYFSPYLEARPGSTHGYDVFDHSHVNTELGGEDDHQRLVDALEARGMRRVLDVVPNHMGIVGPNKYWLDVLENGPLAPSAHFFDIDWHPVKEELEGRVLLPILENQYGLVLEAGKLRLAREDGAFFLQYYDHKLPLCASSYAQILGASLDQLDELALQFDEGDQPYLLEYRSILASSENLPVPQQHKTFAEIRQRTLLETAVIKRRIARLIEDCPPIAAMIDRTIDRLQGIPGDPRSFDALHTILEAQHYRLAYWRVASEEINYRRFFDINELAGLRTEDPPVFLATHDLILDWVAQGNVSCLRIDHPDGLADPSEYFERLQHEIFLRQCRSRYQELLEAQPSLTDTPTNPEPVDPTDRPRIDAANLEGDVAESPDPSGISDPSSLSNALPPWYAVEPYLKRLHSMDLEEDNSSLFARYPIVAEKILSRGEELPVHWPIDGTVGYEFLNALNGLFVDPNGSEPISTTYVEFTGDRDSFVEVTYQAKQLIARSALASELNTLARSLNRVSESSRNSRDFTLNDLRRALREVIAWFPVYRTYHRPGDVVEPRDRAFVEQAVARARQRIPTIDASVFQFLQDALLGELPLALTAESQQTLDTFIVRFQQTTGPIMAKGLEDTANYRQFRLASLNEVGNDPTRFGTSPQAFHQLNLMRLDRWPGLSTTATHDTKRGEDTRIRINVLSELPEEWNTRLARWARWNARKKITQPDERIVPDAREEYLLYQILVGTWPFELLDFDSDEPQEPIAVPNDYVLRVQDYIAKAVREAKVNTTWTDIDPSYVENLTSFVREILQSPDAHPFLKDIVPFIRHVARVGIVHSLGQTLLKLTSPGIPDIYQGCELWDFSLVDPDNRRPVDFDRRRRILDALRGSLEIGTPRAELARRLYGDASSGAIKLYLIYTVLDHRRQQPALYQNGSYRAVEADGERRYQVVASLRQLDGQFALSAVARLVAPLMGEHAEVAPLGDVWSQTHLVLPEALANARLRNLLTDEVHEPVLLENDVPALPLSQLFDVLPVALLVNADLE